MKTKTFFTCLLLLSVLSYTTTARRTGGGGGRRGGSSGGLGSWFSGGSKKTSNPQSSYPKQTWSQSGTGTGAGAARQPGSNLGSGGYGNPNQGVGSFGGNKQGSNIGGGGFANPNQGPGSFGNNRQGNNFGQNYGGGYGYPNNNINRQGSNFGGSSIGGGGFANPNRGWSNPNVGRSHGYYGAGGSSIFGNSYSSYNYRRAPFGGFSGSRGLAVGAGAGFIGGAVAGIAAVSMFHQYRQYQRMMYCIGNPLCYGGGYGYGGYGYGYGHRILINHEDCLGGCPNQAYCDIGVCRCREGYEAKYGQCWKTIEDFNARSKDWEARSKSNYNPYHGCSNHRDCRDVDMNMVCTSNKCACRKDMAWNDEVQECQIFVNVTCSDIDVESSGPQAAALTDLSGANNTSAEYDYDSGNNTIEDFGDNFSPNSNIDEDPFDKVVNVSTLTVNETLADSELLKIDLNKTDEKEVRAAFCREVARTAKRYAPNPIPPKQDESSGSSNTMVTALVVIASIVLIGGIIFYLVKKCSKRGNRGGNKHNSRDYSEDESPRNPPNEAMAFSTLQNPPPYSTNDQGGYPEVPVPYPPGPDNPYFTAQQPGFPQANVQTYPPPQGQVYPYPYPDPNQPYPQNPGMPAYGQAAQPYPPVAGNMPYPPAPYPQAPGQPPYPPQ